ncbi:hypothetical protein BsWGS_08458 [Bradybaena similaris]
MMTLCAFVVFFTLFSRVNAEKEDECPYGRWGDQCSETCGVCAVGDHFCRSSDGFCEAGCASGYTGLHCKERCRPGTYGPYCLYTCGHCSPPECDQTTGKCKACKEDFLMPFCTRKCLLSTDGKSCNQSIDTLTEESCGYGTLARNCLPCNPRSNWHFSVPLQVPDCLPMAILMCCCSIIAYAIIKSLWRFFKNGKRTAEGGQQKCLQKSGHREAEDGEQKCLQRSGHRAALDGEQKCLKRSGHHGAKKGQQKNEKAPQESAAVAYCKRAIKEWEEINRRNSMIDPVHLEKGRELSTFKQELGE